MRGYRWYVLQRADDGWFTVADVVYAPGGEDISRPREVCSARGPDPLPEGLGVFAVRLPDLDLDGRLDLLFECRSGYQHDVQYCLSDKEHCVSIAMRDTREEELVLDLEFEFRLRGPQRWTSRARVRDLTIRRESYPRPKRSARAGSARQAPGGWGWGSQR